MNFNTKYDSHARVYLNPGSPIKDVYSSRYTPSGQLELYVSGQENLYDQIQSHAESVDIHVLLQRFANGDEDVLSRAQGFYLDSSDMPKTYAEVLNSVIQGEQAFDSLPVEVKQRFGNSFSQWMASFESPDFLVKMGIQKATPASSDMSPADVADMTGVHAAPPAGNSLGGDSK